MQLALLLKAVRAFRAGRIGDGGAYKAAALTAPAYPDVRARLARLEQMLPDIRLEELRSLEPGSFGRHCADFMDLNRLTPIVISPEVRAELAAAQPLGLRYALLHDAFHVLLGFDTSLAGELGVWSFVAAQRYSPTFRWAAGLARVLYPLQAPSLRGELRAARLRAEAQAERVPCLIAQPLETLLDLPLLQVRHSLGITVEPLAA